MPLKIKVKVKVNGRETDIKGLLDGMFKTNRRNMAFDATDIIKSKVDQIIHADNPSPTQAKRLMNKEFKNIKEGKVDGFSVVSGVSNNVIKYRDDYVLEERLAAGISAQGKTIKISDDINPTKERKYKLDRRGYIVLDPQRRNPKKWNFNKLYHIGYKIITSWIPGDVVDGVQHKSSKRDGQLVRLGNIAQIRGRDLLMSAFLISISDIIKMMKRRIKRNMGV